MDNFVKGLNFHAWAGAKTGLAVYISVFKPATKNNVVFL
jgi:hypothetical protein